MIISIPSQSIYGSLALPSPPRLSLHKSLKLRGIRTGECVVNRRSISLAIRVTCGTKTESIDDDDDDVPPDPFTRPPPFPPVPASGR